MLLPCLLSECRKPPLALSPIMSTHKGSPLVAKSGINLELVINLKRPRKLLTSDADERRVASFIARNFFSVVPRPCRKRRIPMKTSLPIPKVHFLPFKVRLFSSSLAYNLCKLWSCSTTVLPWTIKSSVLFTTLSMSATTWLIMCWYFLGTTFKKT